MSDDELRERAAKVRLSAQQRDWLRIIVRAGDGTPDTPSDALVFKSLAGLGLAERRGKRYTATDLGRAVDALKK